MELKKINDSTLVSYQRQGHDRNGNPVYIINVFNKYYPVSQCGNNTEWVWANMNYTYSTMTKRKLDKYGNIKVTSYNINDTIQCILESLK